MLTVFQSQRRRCTWRWLFAFSAALIATSAQAQNSTTQLEQLIARSLEQQPRLQAFEARGEQLRGKQSFQSLAPGYRLSLGSENLIGSGDFSGFDATELRLGLGSEFERGDQRQARIASSDAALAVNQQQLLAAAQQLVAEVTSAYLRIVDLQQRITLSTQAVTLAEQALDSVETRVASAAALEVEALRARAALSRTRIERDELHSQLRTAQAQLARFVGDEGTGQPAFPPPSANQSLPAFHELLEDAAGSATMRVLDARIDQQRSEWRLEQSRSQANIAWQLAVRHDRGMNGTALGFDLAIPLNQRERRRGLGLAEQAELTRIEHRREDRWLEIRTALFEAWAGHRQALESAQHYQQALVPALENALEQTRTAYQQGRFRYLDLVDAQRALLQAREAQLNTQHQARLHWARVMALTGRALAPYRDRLTSAHEQRPALPSIQ
jgi:cobalt-zinc-cadmium efflux system outer membrane protein